METSKESVIKKEKRPKSATRYPKRMPTYVVAFAVQETHDEPAKSYQLPNKRSNDSALSTKSISPAESSISGKTFTITPTEKMSHVLDVPTISEVKIDIIDENQCGDTEKKSPQISSYIVVDNRKAEEQPEIIFNATKHIKRCKDNNKFTRKKPKKNKRVIKFKNVHFKYKNPKNSITSRLEKYYEKAKMNSPNPEQIQKQIYCNVLSKVVSRSRVLKKVLAKENLLDDSDRISLYDGDIFLYDDGSINSSPSTTKKSFNSYTSQNTLVHKSSSSSRNEDFYSMKTVNSVIQVPSDISPYKTDVINLAVAVAFSASKPNESQISIHSKEAFLCTENLTREDTFLIPNAALTSEAPSNENVKKLKINYDEWKSITLTEKHLSSDTLTAFEKKSIISNDDDTFVIARTSSDFNKSNFRMSDNTLTSTSENMSRPEDQQAVREPQLLHDDFSNRNTLIDKVINLGYYPEITPSTSSAVNFEYDNDVVISDNLMKSFPFKSKNNIADDLSNLSNVLKKSFDVEKIGGSQKLSLPNEVAIKATLKENEKVQRKTCSQDIRRDVNYPTDLRDMWDRLTLVIDLAVKKLEENLAEKVTKELHTLINNSIFKQREYEEPKLESVRTENPKAKMSHKEINVIEDHLKRLSDVCVQCDLVENTVIDQLMLKLSVEGPKIPSPKVSLKKLMKPQIMKDYFEILKPPVTKSVSEEIGKGDTVTVSTATVEVHAEEETTETNCLQILFSGPMAFIRENLFIITSIPTFFIVLLCLYGILLIILKPW